MNECIMEPDAPVRWEQGDWRVLATPAGDGTWSVDAGKPDGHGLLAEVCFAAERLASPDEGRDVVATVLAARADPAGAACARELGLLPGALTTLRSDVRLVLDALRPAGTLVSMKRLRRVRPDGDELSDDEIVELVMELRASLSTASGGRLGVAHTNRSDYSLFDEGADDWLTIDGFASSRKGLLVLTPAGRIRLNVAHAALLEPLVRAVVTDGPDGYVGQEALIDTLAAVARERDRNDRERAQHLSSTLTKLRTAIGYQIRFVSSVKGYRLVLEPYRRKGDT